MRAVVLCAGVGSRLRPLTDTTPKCLLPVGDSSPLLRGLGQLARVGVAEAIVIVGHLADRIREGVRGAPLPLDVRCVEVANFTVQNSHSLWAARDAVRGDGFYQLDGDLICEDAVFEHLAAAPGPLAIAVDRSVKLGAEEMKVRLADGGAVAELGKGIAPASAHGEAIGVARIDADAVEPLFGILGEIVATSTDQYYEEAYSRWARRGLPARIADVSGLRWQEIDSPEDLERARRDFGRRA